MENCWNIIKNKKNGSKDFPMMFFSLLLMAFLIWIRFSWFDMHFTHYDDIKVDQLTNYQVDLFEVQFAHYKYNGGISGEVYNICYLLFSKIYNAAYNAYNFSKYWTYAPGQFVITFLLLPLGKDYTSIKFFGRFPSLVFGIVALLFLWRVITKMTNSKEVACLATAIMGFSWQSILYCMHMSNYESIILIGCIAALYIIKCLNEKTEKWWVQGGFIFGVLTWFHYQTVCFFGGYLITFVGVSLSEGKSKKKVIRMGEICLLYVMTISPLFLFANMNGVPTWNAGINGEYLFRFTWDMVYFVKFFGINSWRVFKAMLSPVPLYLPIANFYAVGMVILFVLGIIGSLIECKDDMPFFITLFCIGTIGTEYFFVFLGKFTLSPTRHCNVLIPMYVIEISLGIYYLLKQRRSQRLRILAVVGTVFIVCIWSRYYPTIKQDRIDVFSEQLVDQIMMECEPDLVIDRSAPQIWYLLNKETFTRRQIIDYQTDFYDKDNNIDNNHRILIVSHTSQMNDEILKVVSDQLIAEGYLDENKANQLKMTNCIYKYEKTGNTDFDFYNVTSGAANNLFYYLYMVE